MSTVALAFPDEPFSNRLLSIPQVCARLGVSRSTFYDWRLAHKAPRCVRLPNGQLRVYERDLQGWLDEHQEHES